MKNKSSNYLRWRKRYPLEACLFLVSSHKHRHTTLQHYTCPLSRHGTLTDADRYDLIKDRYNLIKDRYDLIKDRYDLITVRPQTASALVCRWLAPGTLTTSVIAGQFFDNTWTHRHFWSFFFLMQHFSIGTHYWGALSDEALFHYEMQNPIFLFVNPIAMILM
jgi:hypothetical protein